MWPPGPGAGQEAGPWSRRSRSTWAAGRKSDSGRVFAGTQRRPSPPGLAGPISAHASLLVLGAVRLLATVALAAQERRKDFGQVNSLLPQTAGSRLLWGPAPGTRASQVGWSEARRLDPGWVPPRGRALQASHTLCGLVSLQPDSARLWHCHSTLPAPVPERTHTGRTRTARAMRKRPRGLGPRQTPPLGRPLCTSASPQREPLAHV